jgi:hypothetical protein
MRKPDFLVIGAMKCASSTVCAFLEDHPEVFMVPRAEPKFFSHDENWARGPEWYAAFFEGAGDARIVGEGTNAYAAGAMHPHAAARIAGFAPDVRIIYMVRDPLARMGSAWVQNRVDSGDRFPPTLDEAIRRMPELYVDQSLYWRNLSLYRAHFPDDRIFVGFMEDLNRDQQSFFRRLTDFLGVAPAAEIQRGHVNPSEGKAVPTALYSRVNRNPLIAILKRLTPKGLRTTVKRRLLSGSAKEVATMSPAVRAETLAAVRDDALALLAHCGKPADFWPLRA